MALQTRSHLLKPKVALMVVPLGVAGPWEPPPPPPPPPEGPEGEPPALLGLLSGAAAGAIVGAILGVSTRASGGKENVEATLMAPGAMMGSQAGEGKPMALLTATVASCRQSRPPQPGYAKH